MTARKTALTGAFDERAVMAAFAVERLVLQRWSNDPGDVYAEHAHSYHKVLYCLRGSIIFRLSGGDTIQLLPGDRLDIESGTAHAAVVGPEGVACVEAARP